MSRISILMLGWALVLSGCLTMVEDPKTELAQKELSSSGQKLSHTRMSLVGGVSWTSFSSGNVLPFSSLGALSSSVSWELSSGGWNLSSQNWNLSSQNWNLSSQNWNLSSQNWNLSSQNWNLSSQKGTFVSSSSSYPRSMVGTWSSSLSSTGISSSGIKVYLPHRKWDMGQMNSVGMFPQDLGVYSAVVPANDLYLGGRSQVRNMKGQDLGTCGDLTRDSCYSMWNAATALSGTTLLADLIISKKSPDGLLTQWNGQKFLPQAGWWILGDVDVNLVQKSSYESHLALLSSMTRPMGLGMDDLLQFHVFVGTGKEIFFELIGTPNSGYDLGVPRFRYVGTGKWEQVNVPVRKFVRQYQPYLMNSQLILDPSQVVGMGIVSHGTTYHGDTTRLYVREVNWLKAI
jgi:hypothetical protein